MFTATKDNLKDHLVNDLGLKKDDLVFMHSGITGLGLLANGSDTITAAFADVLSEGLLVIPSYTYSWCHGKLFDPAVSECPGSVGGYSQSAWKDKRFVRSRDPNFSVAALKNEFNGPLIDRILDIGRSCFGERSVFDHMYKIAQERDGYVMLLGGAHSDCVFRTTFIHYIEETVGVPNRYLKRFYNPRDPGDYVDQLVRFFSEEEYRKATGRTGSHYTFPILPDYTVLGDGLIEKELLMKKPFGYSETRMVHIRDLCELIREQLTQAPDCYVGTEETSFIGGGH